LLPEVLEDLCKTFHVASFSLLARINNEKDQFGVNHFRGDQMRCEKKSPKMWPSQFFLFQNEYTTFTLEKRQPINLGYFVISKTTQINDLPIGEKIEDLTNSCCFKHVYVGQYSVEAYNENSYVATYRHLP
jgi:hypothetical protein